MKTTKQIITIVLALWSFTILAQQAINYKALIKDNDGNIVANQNITVQFQILKGVGMVNIYQETHAPMTDSNGLAIVSIGQGTTSDDFSSIDWGADDHYLNVQIDTGGGLTDMGTTQFMAVPYALFAKETLGSYFFADKDGDGYGDEWNLVYAPSAPPNFVSQPGDCDDLDPTINPGATDIPADGIDQDCDGIDPCEDDMLEPNSDQNTAYNLGVILDTGGEVTVNGRLISDPDEDWYKITVQDELGGIMDPFIEILANPNNQYGFWVYYENPDIPNSLEYVAFVVSGEWSIFFDLPGFDNTITYFVKVVKDGTLDCSDYSFKIIDK